MPVTAHVALVRALERSGDRGHVEIRRVLRCKRPLTGGAVLQSFPALPAETLLSCCSSHRDSS